MTDFHALIHSYQNCACGQAHTCAIRDIEIGSGLVRSVGDILRKNGFGPRLLLAADEQTLAAADGIEASLAGFAVVRHIWPTIRVATMTGSTACWPSGRGRSTTRAGLPARGTTCRCACSPLLRRWTVLRPTPRPS